MTFVIETFSLSDTVELPYVVHGDPGGVPMLMLHGVTDSWRSFESVLPHLPDTIQAIALTQRGHGDATRPATGYRTRDFAADLAAVVRACGRGPVIVVGHSMGTTNAMRFAIDYPELTAGLVLAGTFATYRGNPVLDEFWTAAQTQLADPLDPTFVREFQQSTLARPVPQAVIDTAVRESLKVPARVWRETFAGFFEDDFAGELHRIQAPTLLMWGDRDAFCPRRDQDTLTHAIVGARLVVYEGAGHALHWEQPARFAADLAAFASTILNEATASRFMSSRKSSYSTRD